MTEPPVPDFVIWNDDPDEPAQTSGGTNNIGATYAGTVQDALTFRNEQEQVRSLTLAISMNEQRYEDLRNELGLTLDAGRHSLSRVERQAISQSALLGLARALDNAFDRYFHAVGLLKEMGKLGGWIGKLHADLLSAHLALQASKEQGRLRALLFTADPEHPTAALAASDDARRVLPFVRPSPDPEGAGA